MAEHERLPFLVVVIGVLALVLGGPACSSSNSDNAADTETAGEEETGGEEAVDPSNYTIISGTVEIPDDGEGETSALVVDGAKRANRNAGGRDERPHLKPKWKCL